MLECHIRITPMDIIDEEHIIELLEKFGRFVMYEETKTHKHYHIHMRTEKSVENMRITLNRKGLKGNKYLSIALDKGKSKIYASKGGNLIYNDLFTDAELQEHKEESYEKKGESKVITWTQKVISAYKPATYTDRNQIREDIVDYLLKEIHLSFKGMDDTIYRRLFYGILARHHTDIFRPITNRWATSIMSGDF